MNNNDISPEDCFEEQDSQACEVLITRAWHTVGTHKVYRRQNLKVGAELQDNGKGRQNSPQDSCIIVWAFPTTPPCLLYVLVIDSMVSHHQQDHSLKKAHLLSLLIPQQSGRLEDASKDQEAHGAIIFDSHFPSLPLPSPIAPSLGSCLIRKIPLCLRCKIPYIDRFQITFSLRVSMICSICLWIPGRHWPSAIYSWCWHSIIC